MNWPNSQISHAALALCLGLGGSTYGTNSIGETLVEEPVLPLLDWQPVNLVPDDEIDFRCAQCKGRFEDPLKDVEIELDTDESNLEVSADQTDVTEQELVFTGNVLVKQGLRTMRADAVTADREQQTATATGNVLFREPDAALIGETIY